MLKRVELSNDADRTKLHPAALGNPSSDRTCCSP